MKKLLNLLLIIPVLVYGQGEQLYPGGTATDQDGNSFEWINYGDLDWAIEDSKVETYRDGTDIHFVTENDEWSNMTFGAWCYFDNDPNKARLYNMYSVLGMNDNDPNTENKTLAPEGWRIATPEDWDNLVYYLVSRGYSYNGSSSLNPNNIAKSVAARTGWDDELVNTGSPGYNESSNNSSGLNIKPSGVRGYSGYFIQQGEMNKYYALDTNNNNFQTRTLSVDYSSLLSGAVSNYNWGYSVRFVRDAQTASTNDYSKSAAIYPNPTSSRITIEGGALYEIEVYSLQGRKLMTQKGNSIDLSALSNAIYLIKATNTANMQEQIYKVIKE